MKKMLMLIVSVAMAVVLTGCGCSKQSAEEQEKKAKEGLDFSKGVAESFVNAIVKKDFDKVLACLDTTDTAVFTPKVVKNVKEEFEKLGKEINDDKLEAKAVREEIDVPSESRGYKILNGKKYTGERAMVSVQFVKGKDKLSRGMSIKLVKVDGSWKVEMSDYRIEDGFDTSDNDPAPVRREVPASPVASPAPAAPSPVPEAVPPVPVAAPPASALAFPTPKVAFQTPKMASNSPAPGVASKVGRYERLCDEAASLVKQLGGQVAEEDIEKEVEKFKKLSESDQDKELTEAEEMIEQFKKTLREKKAKNL